VLLSPAAITGAWGAGDGTAKTAVANKARKTKHCMSMDLKIAGLFAGRCRGGNARESLAVKTQLSEVDDLSSSNQARIYTQEVQDKRPIFRHIRRSEHRVWYAARVLSGETSIII